MQTVTQIPRDILYQGCTSNSQNAPVLLEKPSRPDFQHISVHVPFPGISDVQCQSVTTVHSCLAQATTEPPGDRVRIVPTCKRKPDPKAVGQSSQTQLEPVQSPQMLNFSGYSDARPKFVQAYDLYPVQQYFVGNVSPGSYLTITHFNYQQAGFQPFPSAQPSAASPLHGNAGEPYCRCAVPPPFKGEPCTGTGDQLDVGSVKKSEGDSEASGSFEYTIQPEQLVKSLCDERDYDGACPRAGSKVHVRSLSCGSPRTWSTGPSCPQSRTADDQFTKCLAQGCLQAEAIAVRNQNRPCFKNIKHLCTRTRTDILKPKTTVANIHSQGIPWATKDFIFAYIRLINCWHILSGYLENEEGSLGKIDTALSPEIRAKYYRWKSESQGLLVLLNNLFLNLDKGVTIQNAEIFSKYNNLAASQTAAVYQSATLIDPPHSASTSSSSQHPAMYVFSRNEMPPEAADCPADKASSEETKESLAPVNVPGILIVKEMFGRATPATKPEAADVPKEYLKPGTYIPPENDKENGASGAEQADATNTIPDSWESLVYTPVTAADLAPNATSRSLADSQKSADSVWKNAIQTTGSFIKRMMNGAGEAPDKTPTAKNTKDVESWVTEHCFQRAADGDTEENEPANARQPVKFKKHVHCGKSSGKKNVIGTRIYKKKSDDRDANNGGNKVFRYRNGNKSQNKYLARRGEVSRVESDGAPKRAPGLSPLVASKFEKIIHKLWLLPFSKFVTFEVNAEYVPDYYKHVHKPMFLCNVMNNLKQNKYKHVDEVVHDLRRIVWNAELYIQKRPDWWFEKCLQVFSTELESQIANKFANVNFGTGSGEPSRKPAPATAGREQK